MGGGVRSSSKRGLQSLPPPITYTIVPRQSQVIRCESPSLSPLPAFSGATGWHGMGAPIRLRKDPTCPLWRLLYTGSNRQVKLLLARVGRDYGWSAITLFGRTNVLCKFWRLSSCQVLGLFLQTDWYLPGMASTNRKQNEQEYWTNGKYRKVHLRFLAWTQFVCSKYMPCRSPERTFTAIFVTGFGSLRSKQWANQE